MSWMKSMLDWFKLKAKNDEVNFDDVRPVEVMKELDIVDTPAKQDPVTVEPKPKRKYTKRKKVAKKKAK